MLPVEELEYLLNHAKRLDEAWKMLDEDGKLFYLPNPRQVEVEEMVASKAFTAAFFSQS